MREDETKRLTYDVVEAGQRLGLGRNASYEAARRGDIPTIKIGKRILVPKARFDRMLEGRNDPG
jgi:excisionase family DNA binding protein